jgi:UDP-N-acetyl-D-mannosaminuronic acid dehydrogenase
MRLKISSSIQLEEFDAVFVCIGTRPTSRDPDGAQKLIDLVLNCKDSIKKNGQLFIRSTVQLGLTEKISKILYKSRPDINVAFAPERTVEGVALIELDKLPQILGPTSTSDRLLS